MSRKCKIGVFAFLAAVVLVIILSGGYLLTLGGVFHPTVNLTVRFVVYFVDQPQVVDIDRDFGVVDILERGDDIFFYL